MPAHKVDLWLVFGNFIDKYNELRMSVLYTGVELSLNGKNSSLCPNCTSNMVYMNICFPLGVWNGYMLGVHAYYADLPIKTPGTESLMNFSSRQYFTGVTTYC
jgi:hypothetical protein